MTEFVIIAAWLFAITHIDTFIVLVAFSADHAYDHWEVLIGHVVGFTIGLALAVVGALLAARLFQEYAFALGVLPLTLGCWGILNRSAIDTPVDQVEFPSTVARVGAVTMAGIGLSGENVAVFIPFFLTLENIELTVVLLGYLTGAFVLFIVSALVARIAEGRPLPRWVDDWLVPSLLIAIGLYVLTVGWFAVDTGLSLT